REIEGWRGDIAGLMTTFVICPPHTLSSRPEAAFFAAVHSTALRTERPAACLHGHYSLRKQAAGLDAKHATHIRIALCNLQVSPLRMTIKPSCFGRDDSSGVVHCGVIR